MLELQYHQFLKKFWRTNIYSADLLLSISMILLGIVMYQFVPYEEPCLFNISKVIDGNQLYISLFLIAVGFMQMWHVHSGSERRKIPHLVHTLALFLSFGIWLSLTVSSFFNATSIPVATAAYASLMFTNVWVFIRYGCPYVK